MSTLPFLPGYTFNQNLVKTRYTKPHFLDVFNNVPQLLAGPKPGSPTVQISDIKYSALPKGEGAPVPPWIAFDKQALCFNAYWYHTVREARHEDYRVRHAKIFYFLEDDTIQVSNDTPINTGLPEGIINKYIFLKRHRIPLPAPDNDSYYSVEHFNVGKEVTFYGRIFKITSCADEFTKRFLLRVGVKVGEPLNTPSDPGTEHVKQVRDAGSMPLRPYIKKDTLRQFLEFDKQVLRFYGYWDDSHSMYGDVHDMIVLYHLADDSIEIRERILPNIGRDAFPVFVKRGRLPKKVEPVPVPGVREGRSVLNVVGQSGLQGQSHIYDSLQIGEPKIEYYNDKDLMIGAVINAWGRKMMLCDCDEFTKEFYRTKYGITDFTPLQRGSRAPQNIKCQLVIPPHNGFGSEEDSLQNVLRITPKLPQKDFYKFVHFDREARDGHVLRFLARIADPTPISQDRLFIVAYFLLDDTILIFEPVRRNSGIIGGRFLRRVRIKKPIKPNPPPGEIFSEYYEAADFSIGAEMTLNGFKFLIVDADEYCFRYMEEHPEQFLQANISLILRKIKEIIDDQTHDFKAKFVEFDGNDIGLISYNLFKMILNEVTDQLSEHEIVTLSRNYGTVTRKDVFSLECLTGLTHRDLIKAHFDDFPKLFENLQYHDINKTGLLNRKKIYNSCRSFPLPVQQELLRMLIDKLEPADREELNYEEFVELLQWRKHPKKIKIPSYVVFDTIRLECPQMYEIDQIRYKEFMEHVQKS